MPTRTFTHPLFGLVTFTTKHPTWVRGDQITFDSGFDPHEVTPVFIPQLVNRGRTAVMRTIRNCFIVTLLQF